MQLSSMSAQVPQVSLQQGVRIEPHRVEIGDSVAGVFAQQRAQGVNPRRIQSIELSESRDLAIKGIERVQLVLAAVHEQGYAMAERNFREAAARWLTGTEPFTAKLNPAYAPYGDYDQLMRLEEWYGRE